MYCELFKLNEPPFRLSPDPQFLYASKQHARAKAYMESSIWLADGFVVITGEIGSGKTTLIESFLEELPENVILAHINQTQLTPVEFLQALLVEFGFKPFKKRKVELLSMLKDYMIEQYADGKTLLLVIDEAQNLSRHVLEELRMLSGIEAQKEKLLRIILAGQPELSLQLKQRHLEQLKQRVRLQFHLGALSKRETREYIVHRLEVAGASGRKIFEDDAFDPIFSYSGGVPRLVNTLCDTSMLCAFAEEQSVITKELVMEAVEELQWTPFVERYRHAEPESVDIDDTGRNKDVLPSPAHFDILFRDQFVSEFELPLGRTIIGRTTDNDLQISSKFISRHHAQVSTRADGCTLEDLNSTNGVFIEARRVKRHQLVDGDEIQLGEHKLVYHDRRSRSGVFEMDDSEDEDFDDEAGAEDDDASERETEASAPIPD
jgi:type II secretory pathway predicted ATPase ExeA/pSer/pThr/pTyr-binding forkhead associated (FHA) protein